MVPREFPFSKRRTALPARVCAAIEQGEVERLLLDVQGAGLQLVEYELELDLDAVEGPDPLAVPRARFAPEDPAAVERMADLVVKLGLRQNREG